jgi:hypothetical protein
MSIIIYRKVTTPVPVTNLPVALLHMAQIWLQKLSPVPQTICTVFAYPKVGLRLPLNGHSLSNTDCKDHRTTETLHYSLKTFLVFSAYRQSYQRHVHEVLRICIIVHKTTNICFTLLMYPLQEQHKRKVGYTQLRIQYLNYWSVIKECATFHNRCPIQCRARDPGLVPQFYKKQDEGC